MVCVWTDVFQTVVMFAGQLAVIVVGASQAGTWRSAQNNKGIYVSWAFMVLLAVFCLARTLYWVCLQISYPLQNSP